MSFWFKSLETGCKTVLTLHAIHLLISYRTDITVKNNRTSSTQKAFIGLYCVKLIHAEEVSYYYSGEWLWPYTKTQRYSVHWKTTIIESENVKKI